MAKRYHVKSTEDLNNLNTVINNNNSKPNINNTTTEAAPYDESINIMSDGMLESVSPTDMAILAVLKDSPEVQNNDKTNR